MSSDGDSVDSSSLSNVELCVLKQLDEGERMTFEELNKHLPDVPKNQVEDAVRHLLHTQRLAETGDWKYYATSTGREVLPS